MTQLETMYYNLSDYLSYPLRQCLGVDSNDRQHSPDVGPLLPRYLLPSSEVRAGTPPAAPQVPLCQGGSVLLVLAGTLSGDARSYWSYQGEVGRAAFSEL